MQIRKKVKGAAMTIPAGLGISLLVSMIITLAGAAAASHLIASEKIGEGSIGFAAMVILAIAAIMGAWCAISLVKRLRLQVCMMAGGCYYLTLLAMTALLFGGQYQGMGVTAIVILAGCAVVAFFPTKMGGNRKHKKRAYR